METTGRPRPEQATRAETPKHGHRRGINHLGAAPRSPRCCRGSGRLRGVEGAAAGDEHQVWAALLRPDRGRQLGLQHRLDGRDAVGARRAVGGGQLDDRSRPRVLQREERPGTCLWRCRRGRRSRSSPWASPRCGAVDPPGRPVDVGRTRRGSPCFRSIPVAATGASMPSDAICTRIGLVRARRADRDERG